MFSLGDLFKGLIGPSAAGAGGALKNAMNSTTMDSQQRKIGGRKFDRNSKTNNPVKNIDPEMLKPRQPMQYAQYKNPDGSGGGFGPNRPMPRFDRGMPQMPMYEDGSPIFNMQPNINTQSIPQGQVFDPMQNAVRFQLGAQNQFMPGQNPFQNEDYRNRLRVR